MPGLLEVKNLSVSFFTPSGEVQAVRDVSFSLQEGEVLAIVGESGCGKSALCRSILKLLPQTAKIKSGSIAVRGTEITHYREQDMRRLRGSLFSMVFQDPMTSLNPTMTIGAQIGEAVRVHQPHIGRAALRERVAALMALVGMDRPEERMTLYPCHFSGGMRQRAVLAVALAGDPAILFADEPTTALDVTIQAQILDLLRDIQQKRKTATVFVTHDLGVVARVADRVAVMYAGKIVETGTAEEIFYDPRHPYTQGLLRALPARCKGRDSLPAIPGMPPTLIHPPKGDAFACRNPCALAIDYEEAPPLFPITDTHHAATWLLDKRAPEPKQFPCVPPLYGQGEHMENISTAQARPETPPPEGGGGTAREILLDVQHLTHIFPVTKKLAVKAVDDVSFQIFRGEIFGLVGESGSGKSTVARCIMNLYRPYSGRILYRGLDICNPHVFRKNRRMLQTARQMIFQDSHSSLDPRMTAAEIIAEPMKIQRITPLRGSHRAEAEFQMKYVGLDAGYLDKYPPELSGGQRQRVAIARALSMEPALLVADEPVASLDVSIQAQIVNLFRHLQREHGFSFLFIAHDLAMVEFLCDRVGVMYQGRLVEAAPVQELFGAPLHPYTKALLSAIPIPDPLRERARRLTAFEGEALSPGGAWIEASPGHFVLQEGRP